jgi:transposase
MLLLKNNMNLYKLDQLANGKGHQIVQLPPYHSQYNPIELMWPQMKWEVAKKKKKTRFQTWKD